MIDGDLFSILYKFAIVPLSVIFWWFFKKIDYRLERTELSNATIQKEFELRMQTMEKALNLRVQELEKANVAILVRLDVIKEVLVEIKEVQKALLNVVAKPASRSRGKNEQFD